MSYEKYLLIYFSVKSNPGHLYGEYMLSTQQEARRIANKKFRRKLKYSYIRNKRLELKNTSEGRQLIQQVHEENIKKYGILTCELCFKPIAFGDDTIDHKKSLYGRGDNVRSNLHVACSNCNSKKLTKSIKTFYHRYRMLYKKKLAVSDCSTYV